MRAGRGSAGHWGFRQWKGPRPGRGLWGLKHGWWVVICLLYIVSPIDAIPDFIPVLGQMDDAGVFVFMLFNLFHWLRESGWLADLWRGKRRDTLVYAPGGSGPMVARSGAVRTYEVQVTDDRGEERWVTVEAPSPEDARRGVAAAGNYRSVGRVRARAA